MNDTTRFLAAKTAVFTAGIAGALALTACSGGGTSTVSGRLDDTKYVKSVKAIPAKTHKETRKEPKNKRECSRYQKGVCKSYRTVSDGFRTVTVTVTDKPGSSGKAAKYCVELDDVNGHNDQDDQWYEVSWSTYQKWSGKDEGVKVKKMEYQRSLSSCTR